MPGSYPAGRGRPRRERRRHVGEHTIRRRAVRVSPGMSTTQTTERGGRGRWVAAVVIALIVVIGLVLLGHSGGGSAGGGVGY